jgi:hypothetical protein
VHEIISYFYSETSNLSPLSNLNQPKQRRKQSAGEENVPRDVYVEADGNHFARDQDDDADYYANEENKSSSGSRVASIRTSLSRGIRSKFGKKNSANDTGDYQAPV